MRRQLLAVSFGILVGAVAAHYLDTRPPSTDPTTSSSTASSAPTPGRSNRAAVRNDFRSAFEALLAIVGEDERGIAATLASLPPNVDSPSLKVEVIAAAARTSPSAALHAAVLLDDPVDQARALERIASIWVQLDPPAARSRSSTLLPTSAYETRFEQPCCANGRAKTRSRWLPISASTAT